MWWHYLMLLLAPVALARPRFSGLWLLLFATAVLPLVGHPLVAWPNGAFYPLATAATLMALVLGSIIRQDHIRTADRGVSQLLIAEPEPEAREHEKRHHGEAYDRR
jgi:hypothetical protein